MLDTPENLRKAAFDGEVVDIELSRAVDPSELAFLSGAALVEGLLRGGGDDAVGVAGLVDALAFP
jgi:hypothetical protein